MFLIAAWLINLADCSFGIWKYRRMVHLAKSYPPEMVQSKLADVTYNRTYFAEGFLYTLYLWLVKGSFICMYAELYGYENTKPRNFAENKSSNAAAT